MGSSERNGRNEAAVRRTSARVSGENAKVNLIPDGVSVIIEEKKEP